MARTDETNVVIAKIGRLFSGLTQAWADLSK
jgi:hypothetical protein